MESATPSSVPSQLESRTRTTPLPRTNTLEPTDENITRLISIIASAFAATPLFLAFVTELDSLPPTTPSSAITPHRRQSYYTDGITRVARSGALLVESGSFSAVAIWEPPSFQGADFSSSRKHWGSMSRVWARQVKRTRVRYLGVEGQNLPIEDVTEMSEIKLRPFWHLGFLARNPEVESVPGAVSAVVLPFLERARSERVPAWLEATTETGVRMYEFFGFRLVETITVGGGKYGSDGWFEEGGKGVSGYCMIYDGHLK